MENIYKINLAMYSSKYACDEINELCLAKEKIAIDKGIEGKEFYDIRGNYLRECFFQIIREGKCLDFEKRGISYIVKKSNRYSSGVDYIYLYKDGTQVQEQILPYLPDSQEEFMMVKEKGKYGDLINKFKIADYTRNFM